MSDTTDTSDIPRIYPDQPEKPAGPALPPPLPATPAAAAGDGAKDQAERDRAFDADYEWNGKALLPLSIDRESLFLQLRTAVGAGDIMAAVRDFDGFLADAIRILFICAHTPEELRPLRRDPLLFQECVEAWAVKNVKPEQRSRAIAQAINMYADTKATEHEPVPAGEKDESGN
jgi:hypothetical protein